MVRKNVYIVIRRPKVREAENLNLVTDQPTKSYQSTLHRPVLFRRCEEGISYLTKGLQKTIDSHKQKQAMSTRPMLTELGEEWSKGTGKNIPATWHDGINEVWRNMGEEKQEYPDTEKSELFGPKNRA